MSGPCPVCPVSCYWPYPFAPFRNATRGDQPFGGTLERLLLRVLVLAVADHPGVATHAPVILAHARRILRNVTVGWRDYAFAGDSIDQQVEGSFLLRRQA